MRDTDALAGCAQRHRTARPGGRSLAPPATVPEERGGGGRSELRWCPASGNTTLHLPSPHQRQVVMVTAFTVAHSGPALVGAVESVTAAQAEPRGKLERQAMRTSSGSCGLPQS